MPTDIVVIEDFKDFYAVLIERIEAGDIDEAVDMLLDLNDLPRQLEALFTLADNLARARVLAVADNLAHDVARDIDLARFLANDLARARILALTDDFGFVNNLASAHVRARDLDLARARNSLRSGHLSVIFERANHFNTVIIRTLEAIQQISAETRRPLKTIETIGATFLDTVHQKLEIAPKKDNIPLTFTSIEVLTPNIILTEVAPYLVALGDLQALISQMRGELIPTPHVRKISQSSPVQVLIDGVTAAISGVSILIIPWKREHAKQLASIELRAKALEVEEREIRLRKQATEAKQIARHEETRRQAEDEKMQLDNQRLRLELEKEQLEIQARKLALAKDFIEQLAPNLSDSAKFEYLPVVLPLLDVFIKSPLELEVGGNEAEKPN